MPRDGRWDSASPSGIVRRRSLAIGVSRPHQAAQLLTC